MSEPWLVQVRHGLLELCVLTLIAQAPRYGYELTAALSRWPLLAASEGTLYPLLRRLQRDGTISAAWYESHDGPPRKYYQLTAAGQDVLQIRGAGWDQLVAAIGELRAADAASPQSSA